MQSEESVANLNYVSAFFEKDSPPYLTFSVRSIKDQMETNYLVSTTVVFTFELQGSGSFLPLRCMKKDQTWAWMAQGKRSYTIYQASLTGGWNLSEQFNKQEHHQNQVQSWLSSDCVCVPVPSVNDDDSFSGCGDSLRGAEGRITHGGS